MSANERLKEERVAARAYTIQVVAGAISANERLKEVRKKSGNAQHAPVAGAMRANERLKACCGTWIINARGRRRGN